MSGSPSATPGVTYNGCRSCEWNINISTRTFSHGLRGSLTVALETLFCTLIGSLAQKRTADWPAEVATADASKRTRGHTNSASQRRCPLAPSTTCACERCFLKNSPGFSICLHCERSFHFTFMIPFAELWIKRSSTPSSLKCPGAGWLQHI